MYRDDLIRAKKAAMKLSNEQLAVKSDLSATTISKICNGGDRVEIETLNKVAEALNISMSDLFAPATQAVSIK